MTTRHVFQLCLVATTLCLVVAQSDTHAEVVKWRHNLDTAKIEAAQTGKLVLLHFWSSSCGPCKKLDAEVFSQPQVGEMLEQNYVPVKINADMSPALAGSFRIDRVPIDIVLTSQGNVVAKLACPPTPAGYGSQLVNLAQHYRQQVATNKAPAQPPVQAAYAGLQIGQYNQAPATAIRAAVQPNQTSQLQTSQPTGPPVIAPKSGPRESGPQVTHNIYATATPNPQAPGQPVSAAPDRYSNQHVAAPQQSAPSTQQPANVQTTPAQVASQPPVVQPQTPAAPSQPVANLVTTNAAPAVAKPVGPPKLPEGTPPLAFEGYCPVTLKQVRKWVIGDPKYGAIHRGRTYLFTGEAQRQQFLANPDAYSPVFSGMDPVQLLDENKTVEGSRRFGYEYRGAFYLFSSQESMARFASQPDRYAAGVRQAMTRMDTSGSGTLRR